MCEHTQSLYVHPYVKASQSRYALSRFIKREVSLCATGSLPVFRCSADLSFFTPVARRVPESLEINLGMV